MGPFDYLSKSSFVLAKNCRTKLYYRKHNYDEEIDDFGQQLISDGYKIGKFAQIVYEPGVTIEIDEGIEKAIERTKELLLSNQNITIFEAAIYVNKKLALVDVLEKRGNCINIKEVKSKSFYKEGKPAQKTNKNQIRSEWLKYFYDIAYQYSVVSEYSEKNRLNYEIHPYLVLIDNEKVINIDGLSFMFGIVEKFELEENAYRHVEIDFNGDKKQVKDNNILKELYVMEDVIKLQTIINEDSVNFIKDLQNMSLGEKFITTLTTKCNSCQYSFNPKNGFRECWGTMADVTPNLFDLYFGTTIGGTKEPYYNSLISAKKFSLFDIDTSRIKSDSDRGNRQNVQITFTKSGKSWCSSVLNETIKKFKYPLYFIDFETARLKIPPYRNLKPNNILAFQYSCHVVKDENSKPEHFEYLHQENSFPNFDFANDLMNKIGDSGTYFMWHHHEKDTLTDILQQYKRFGNADSKLEEFLVRVSEETFFTDMCRLCELNFFHPQMKGKNSLKYVLPSIWLNYKSINQNPWFKDYYRLEDGKIINPYDCLPHESIVNESEIIKEGTGAIIGYQKYLNALQRESSEAKKWRNLLLQYCKLDTMAMVIVWKHWKNLSNGNVEIIESFD